MESTTFVGGHTASILCASAFDNGAAVSAGENGEVCLWSSDGKVVKTVCLSNKQDVMSILGSKLDLNTILLASGSCVKKYDIRQFEQPTENIELECDEINQIALSDDEKFLAVAEDSGHVIVYNLGDKKVSRTLRKHSNMCSSVSFRPGKANELYSVSYDKKLIHWDFHRVRTLNIIDMDTLDAGPESVSKYMINPPFIHTLSVSVDGNFVACGTENAKVQVFNGRRRNLEFINTLSGHRLGVSQVHFPRTGKNELLVSGGNDGQVLLWHTSALTAKKTKENEEEEESVLPWYTVNHGEKINWLTSAGTDTNSLFLFVCDSSSTMTRYTVGQV